MQRNIRMNAICALDALVGPNGSTSMVRSAYRVVGARCTSFATWQQDGGAQAKRNAHVALPCIGTGGVHPEI